LWAYNFGGKEEGWSKGGCRRLGRAEIGFAMASSSLLNSLVAVPVGSFGNLDGDGGVRIGVWVRSLTVTVL
jgi:hypothetical protein